MNLQQSTMSLEQSTVNLQQSIMNDEPSTILSPRKEIGCLIMKEDEPSCLFDPQSQGSSKCFPSPKPDLDDKQIKESEEARPKRRGSDKRRFKSLSASEYQSMPMATETNTLTKRRNSFPPSSTKSVPRRDDSLRKRRAMCLQKVTDLYEERKDHVSELFEDRWIIIDDLDE